MGTPLFMTQSPSAVKGPKQTAINSGRPVVATTLDSLANKYSVEVTIARSLFLSLLINRRTAGNHTLVGRRVVD